MALESLNCVSLTPSIMLHMAEHQSAEEQRGDLGKHGTLHTWAALTHSWIQSASSTVMASVDSFPLKPMELSQGDRRGGIRARHSTLCCKQSWFVGCFKLLRYSLVAKKG